MPVPHGALPDGSLRVALLCRNTPASQDRASSITFKGLLNFTNSQQSAGPASGNCLINSLINNQQQPMQEVLGEVTELYVENIDQHPYHHHVQPYQIVALDNDTDEMNAWWRVRACGLLPALMLECIRVAVMGGMLGKGSYWSQWQSVRQDLMSYVPLCIDEGVVRCLCSPSKDKTFRADLVLEFKGSKP